MGVPFGWAGGLVPVSDVEGEGCAEIDDGPEQHLRIGAVSFQIAQISGKRFGQLLSDVLGPLPLPQGGEAELRGDHLGGGEIVRAAARSDISEEVTRFRAHMAHWEALVDGEEACGRKLDFLLQEMNREVNTFGAKADGLGVPELIINAKAELEKMREQVQNVE